MNFQYKQLIALLALISFLTVVLFSLSFMMPGPDGRMPGDCPFSAMGTSLCPQDTLAMTVHHISAYSNFLNVPVSSIGMLIISLLLAIGALILISIRSLIIDPPALSYIRADNPSDYFYKRKITRWLSLFENSPSVV